MFVTARPTAANRDNIPADVVAAIEELKKSLNAVILAHYYQDSEIQDVADFIGDSSGIVTQSGEYRCGCHRVCWRSLYGGNCQDFESSNKLVLLPDLAAGCSLADSCPPDAFATFKAKYPDHIVISYINCTS